MHMVGSIASLVLIMNVLYSARTVQYPSDSGQSQQLPELCISLSAKVFCHWDKQHCIVLWSFVFALIESLQCVNVLPVFS